MKSGGAVGQPRRAPRHGGTRLRSQLVGKRVASLAMNPFDNGRRGIAYNPVLTMDDGTVMRFSVQETDVGEYGVDIVVSQAKRAR